LTWLARVVLATGPWGVLMIVGAIGLALLRLRRIVAWLGSLPKRARLAVMVRYARWKFIRELEKPWKR
jgi:hypothetical protein